MKIYLVLLAAIFFEILGTTCMKLSNGLQNLAAFFAALVFYIICLVFLTLTMKRMELNVAYALWSGVGTALTALIGFTVFKEKVNWVQICSLLLIIIGVVGLHLTRKSI